VVQSQNRVRNGVRSDKISEVEEILEPSMVLFLGPLVPGSILLIFQIAAVCLTMRKTGQGDEKKEGDSVRGVKLRGGGIWAALAAPIIFVGFDGWLLLSASPHPAYYQNGHLMVYFAFINKTS
jgi:hypothetical protein